MPVRARPLAVLLSLFSASASAQTPAPFPADTLSLPEARVEAARGAVSVADAPFAVAVVARDAQERLADPGAGLDIALRRVPGLYVADRGNPSQGERLVVRGLGARAAFGVRGVQVVLDGVPLTLADGQAVLGVIDPALVRRAEIVRGPASALWGNGSGGVLFLDTTPSPGDGGASARALGGAFGLARVEGEAVGRAGLHRAGVALSHTRGQGYRDYSAFETMRGRAFGDVRLGPAADLRLVAAFEDAPRLENPGALTADQLAGDRRQAEARTVQTASGKASRQGQAAATLRTAVGPGEATATVYGIARDLDNPLPFAYVAVDRVAGGTRLAAERRVGPVRLTLGADAAVQRDRRTNRPNEAGTPGAEVLLDQTETVRQGALFARAGLDLAPFGLPGVLVEGALRSDRVRFEAADRRLADGDQSGSRTLGAVSPQAGVSVRLGPAVAFASASTAFETPTTTELVNRPDGAGGFNPDLRPQRTAGVEAGARGVAGRVLYDVAVYALNVRDGLAPFEGENGRTFYANRARARHRGAEASAEWRPGEAFEAAATYTWTRLRFGAGTVAPTGENVEGRTVPGVPEHRLAARARLSRGGLFVAPEVVAAAGFYADDLNAVRTDASVTLDVVLGHAGVRAGRAVFAPFVRVQNVFDARVVGAVVANALGGRYFEPAAGRSVQAGLGVRL